MTVAIPEGDGLELQKAVFAALSADSVLKVLLGDPARVYDTVPGQERRNIGGTLIKDDVTYPYLTLGPDIETPDLADCFDGSDWQLNVHGWTRAPTRPDEPQYGGQAYSKLVAYQVRRVLHAAPLQMEKTRVVVMHRAGIVFQRDPDGITYHSICRFRALTEPA